MTALEVKIAMNDESIDAVFRGQVEALARNLNFDYKRSGKVAIVVDEMDTNLYKYSERGEENSERGEEHREACKSGLETGLKPEGLDGGLAASSLSVRSQVEKESNFSRSLPNLTEVDKDAAHSGTEPGASSDVKSILLIDDEEVSRYLLKRSLKDTGHRIVEAGGGVEGLKRARLEKPDLIVLDLTMPNKDGFEVIEELKSDPWTASIPVVIHSSLTLRPEDLSRLAGRQAAILPKSPDSGADAIRIVRKLLDKPHLFD